MILFQKDSSFLILGLICISKVLWEIILSRDTKQILNIKCIFCLLCCTYVFINFLLSCAFVSKRKAKQVNKQKAKKKQNKTKQTKNTFMAVLKTAGENMCYYNFWVPSPYFFLAYFVLHSVNMYFLSLT